MSTGRSNALNALPPGSFLTYFRPPNQPKRCTSRYHQRPPPQSSKQGLRAPLLPRIPEDVDTDDDVDEESQLGFFDHYNPNEDDSEVFEEDERAWNCPDMIGFLGYTLLVLLIVLNLDFLLSTFNAGSGLVDWDSYAIGSEPTDYEMHFCLVEQNREAPTSRVWRYITADSRDYCTTRTLTLYAAASEEWKLLSEDTMVVEDAAEASRGHEEGHSIGKSSAEKQDLGLSDDPAEEGALRREHII